MEHKAFVFDYEAFSAELMPILEKALALHDCSGLRDFIVGNLASLTDPYEGAPLDDDWESLIETRDEHQYGDFALTKYYNPSDDIGLGSDWDEVQEVVGGAVTEGRSPILGNTIGPAENLFDPGKMGSYFQSAGDARSNCEALMGVNRADDAVDLLRQAVEVSRGMYVSF